MDRGTNAVGTLQGNSFQLANGFTIGSRSGGYTLVSVSAQFGSQIGSPGNISVALHAESGSNPGDPAATAQVTLTGSNPTAAGTYPYTCSGNGCALSASTTYFLVISAPNATGNNSYYSWADTDSDDQTSGDGWLIADVARVKLGANAWDVNVNNQSLMFSVTAN